MKRSSAKCCQRWALILETLKDSYAKTLTEVGIDPALLNVARWGQLILLNAALPNIARGGH